MSKAKFKSVPIKDYVFQAPGIQKKDYQVGFFPPTNTKITFQMPRKAKKPKKEQKPQHLVNNYSFQHELKGMVYQEFSQIPSLFFRKISSISLITPQEMQEKQSPSVFSPTHRSCPLNSFRAYTRERPKTSMITSRRGKIDEEQGCFSPKILREPKQKRKTEKIDVFIKCPSFEISEMDL